MTPATRLAAAAPWGYRDHMRWHVVAFAGVVACSGGPDEQVPDAGRDGPPPDGADGCLGCDAPVACQPWALEARPATALALLDDPSPIAGRTLRVQVDVAGGAFDEPAMPDVAIAGATATITPRAFALVGGPGGGPRAARRVVALRLTAGTWTIAAPGAAALTVTVGPASLRPCGAPGECVQDCDCDQAAGERCLAGAGLGGPFHACAVPCEVDRDCGGHGSCQSIPDSLLFACASQPPECGPTKACPTGFACQAGACAPTFVLSSGSRHACGCDADCDPGLRCVGTAGTARCQAVCPTDGPWCQGAHVCGPASADLGGLATSDAACGFLGE